MDKCCNFFPWLGDDIIDEILLKFERQKKNKVENKVDNTR